MEPYKLPEGKGSLFYTSTGDLLHLTPSLVESLAVLKLQPGEEFGVVCYQRKHAAPEWQMWLTPETEKKRAAREVAELDLEAQLGASLKLVERRKGVSPGEGMPEVLPLAPTGTEGRHASALPVPEKRPALAAVASGGRRRAGGQIPLNIAFREIVRFVVAELKDSGEQWSDQCRQDLVSTVMIAAQKANLLGVWEREDAA